MRTGYIVMSDHGHGYCDVSGHIEDRSDGLVAESPHFDNLRSAAEWFTNRCKLCIVRSEIASDNVPAGCSLSST